MTDQKEKCYICGKLFTQCICPICAFYKCKTKFGFLPWKRHHCRRCGIPICATHTKKDEEFDKVCKDIRGSSSAEICEKNIKDIKNHEFTMDMLTQEIPRPTLKRAHSGRKYGGKRKTRKRRRRKRRRRRRKKTRRKRRRRNTRKRSRKTRSLHGCNR